MNKVNKEKKGESTVSPTPLNTVSLHQSKINLLKLNVCEMACRCGWSISFSSSDYNELDRLICWLNETYNGVVDRRESKQHFDHYKEIITGSKVFLGLALKKILGKDIYHFLETMVYTEQQERYIDRRKDFVQEVLSDDQRSLALAFKNGMQSKFKMCCIEFFARCIMLYVRPRDHGAVPDPEIDGYMRCPKCAKELGLTTEKEKIKWR